MLHWFNEPGPGRTGRPAPASSCGLARPLLQAILEMLLGDAFCHFAEILAIALTVMWTLPVRIIMLQTAGRLAGTHHPARSPSCRDGTATMYGSWIPWSAAIS